jgi:hypothetical protein
MTSDVIPWRRQCITSLVIRAYLHRVHIKSLYKTPYPDMNFASCSYKLSSFDFLLQCLFQGITSLVIRAYYMVQRSCRDKAGQKRIILKNIFTGMQGLDWSGLGSRRVEPDLHCHPYAMYPFKSPLTTEHQSALSDSSHCSHVETRSCQSVVWFYNWVAVKRLYIYTHI